MAKAKKQNKKRKPVKTLKGNFTGPSLRTLKAMLDYRITLEIMELFEEDSHRTGKPYRGGEFENLDRIIRLYEDLQE